MESHPAPETPYARALATLRASPLRVTSQRKAILLLLTTEHGPFSAEEIREKLPTNSCDLVTVYRSLAAMEEIGLVRRCDFGDGCYRYECGTGHHHHHLICRSCRKVIILDLCVADSLERIARQKGYANVTHTLEVFGVCPDCALR